MKKKILSSIIIVLLCISMTGSCLSFSIIKRSNQSETTTNASKSFASKLQKKFSELLKQNNSAEEPISAEYSIPSGNKQYNVSTDFTTAANAEHADLATQIKELAAQYYPEESSTSSKDNVNIWDVIKFIYTIVKVYSIDKPATTAGSVFSTSTSTAILCSLCYTSDEAKPIGIANATLKSGNSSREVTLITLGGTEFKDGQATGVVEDLLSGMEMNNDYLKDIIALFGTENAGGKFETTKDSKGNVIINPNKDIVIIGISLGGMVAQQVIAQKIIADNYNITDIVCYGSSFISAVGRDYEPNCTIRRICDSSDIVPHASVSAILNKDVSAYDHEISIETGGYKTFIGAHAISYVSNECWNGYDALGDDGGNASLTLTSDLVLYSAPASN